MLWYSDVEKICRKMQDDAFVNERALEIAKIERCWDFYKGNQTPYARRYRDETQTEWEEKEKIPFNYFKKIIDKYVYGVSGQKITITFEDEKYQEIWDKVIDPLTDDETHINRQFMTIQRIAEISNTCLAIIRTKEDKESREVLPYFEPIDGKYIDFIPDEEDNNKIAKVIICYNYDNKGVDSRTNSRYLKRVEIWSKESQVIAIWDEEKNIFVEKPIENENPYGFIPMAIFQPQEDHESFWGISMADDLCQVNRVYNDLWTYFNTIIEMQSFSTLVITTHGDEVEVKLGPKRHLKFEGMEEGMNADDAKFITPNPDIEGVRKSIEAFKNELTDVSSVPSSVTFSGSFGAPESGYHLKIKQEPIKELWDSRKLSYGPSYNQLAQKTIKVYEIANGKSAQEVNKIKIVSSVKFSNPPVVIPAIEKMSQDEFDLRYDLITQVDMMMEKYPDLTKEEAEKKLIENIITNNKIEMASFGKSNRDLKILELEEALDNATDEEEIKRISSQLINLGRVQELQKDEIEIRSRKDR